jgi:hypothetical protein
MKRLIFEMNAHPMFTQLQRAQINLESTETDESVPGRIGFHREIPMVPDQIAGERIMPRQSVARSFLLISNAPKVSRSSLKVLGAAEEQARKLLLSYT